MAIVSYAKSISDVHKIAAKIAAKKGIKCDRLCDTCAFKWDQPHTLPYFVAADNAAAQLLRGGQFNCHTQDSFQCLDKPCAGFSLIKLIFGDTITE